MTDPIERAVQSVEYINVGAGTPLRVQGEVIAETLSCISVNGQELATFMCSPKDLDLLAIGFLYNEGLIQSMAEVQSIHQSASDCIDIWIAHFEKPQRKIITAGCGGGVTFDDLSKKYPPLTSDCQVSAEELAGLMRQLHLGAELYQRSRGVHTAALAENGQILLQVEDIGRHNCMDKLAGKALVTGMATRGKILLSSGRISSEMINKARRMEAPIIGSRTSPTSLSVALAESWNITIVAYLRQSRMRIYTHPGRIQTDLPVTTISTTHSHADEFEGHSDD